MAVEMRTDTEMAHQAEYCAIDKISCINIWKGVNTVRVCKIINMKDVSKRVH